MIWHSYKFEEKGSAYEGNLKYTAVAFVPERKIIMTGGVYSQSCLPSSTVFMIDLAVHTDRPIKKKNMLLKRYGHQAVYVNGLVYAIGGFSHKDLPHELPVTLASVEKYSVVENSWVYVSTMSEPRAFSGHIVLDNQFIYMFGGMHDFNILQTIEKYDTISDSWVTVYFMLPRPLAKLGVCLIDREAILICGGMSTDFEARKEVYTFSLEHTTWKRKSDLP
jgi:N-acetylneuraminic acid mutarotase